MDAIHLEISQIQLLTSKEVYENETVRSLA